MFHGKDLVPLSFAKKTTLKEPLKINISNKFISFDYSCAGHRSLRVFTNSNEKESENNKTPFADQQRNI